MSKKIAIASDHGGFELKERIVKKLEQEGLEVLDLGAYSSQSVDYPEVAKKMAETIKENKAEKGILLCGTGIGISIAANRFDFIRAALVHDAFGARLCREHNDANVLVLGGRTIGIEVAFECIDIYLNTKFLGDRHQRRVDMLSCMC